MALRFCCFCCFCFFGGGGGGVRHARSLEWAGDHDPPRVQTPFLLQGGLGVALTSTGRVYSNEPSKPGVWVLDRHLEDLVDPTSEMRQGSWTFGFRRTAHDTAPHHASQHSTALILPSIEVLNTQATISVSQSVSQCRGDPRG